MRIKVLENAQNIQFFTHGLSDDRFVALAKRKLPKLLGLPVADVYRMDSIGFFPNRVVFEIPLKSFFIGGDGDFTISNIISDDDIPKTADDLENELIHIFKEYLSYDKVKPYFANKDYDCEYAFTENGNLRMDYFTDAIADEEENDHALIIDPNASMNTELHNMADAAKYAIEQLKKGRE